MIVSGTILKHQNRAACTDLQEVKSGLEVSKARAVRVHSGPKCYTLFRPDRPPGAALPHSRNQLLSTFCCDEFLPQHRAIPLSRPSSCRDNWAQVGGLVNWVQSHSTRAHRRNFFNDGWAMWCRSRCALPSHVLQRRQLPNSCFHLCRKQTMRLV